MRSLSGACQQRTAFGFHNISKLGPCVLAPLPMRTREAQLPAHKGSAELSIAVRSRFSYITY
jgi:hypothetical protein